MVVRTTGTDLFNVPDLTPEDVAKWIDYQTQWWRNFNKDALTVGKCALKISGDAVQVSHSALFSGGFGIVFLIRVPSLVRMRCGEPFRLHDSLNKVLNAVFVVPSGKGIPSRPQWTR